jgi:hypothetical protein
MARVLKDGRELMRCIHPSRGLLRKLLGMGAAGVAKRKPRLTAPGMRASAGR